MGRGGFDDDMPGEPSSKSGQIYVSKMIAIASVCVLAASILLVGLLCGLLPSNEICENTPEPTIGKPDTEIPSTENLPTEKPSTTAGPIPSSTGPPQAWNSLRLPGDLIPSHYDIELKIDITDDQKFEGTISILMECVKSTNLILLHSKELTIFSATVELVSISGGVVPDFVQEPWLFPENQYLVVQLADALTAGEQYRFSIQFEAQLLDGLSGLYRSSYLTESADPSIPGERRYLATTFFAPTDTRMAFPCFDEPAMKVTFNLTLIHQPGYLALGNMPLLINETMTDGWVKSVFYKSVPMSTYLICFVVCDFGYEEMTTDNGVTLRVWARTDALDSVSYAVEKGVEILDFFDAYFGTEFPLPKMDMIAIPDFSAGAMENWGLITYRESALLFTPNVSSASNQQRVCAIVAHELAHQWFGNLVTLEWWDDTWLNEGFASYVEYLGTDAAEPDWGMLDQFVSADLQVALDADALATSRPITVDVETPDDINQQFDTISYNKGASILRMLQNFMGESTFRTGLANYLDEFAYKNAKNTDLWRVLTEAANADGKVIDVETIMNTWLLQMNYPSVNVTRDYQSSFSLEQSRFLINPAANTTTEYGDLGYLWYVPLRYTTRDERNFSNPTLVWMEPTSDSSPIDIPATTADDWVLANVNAYGFYRVNYDAQNWDLLSQQLSTNHTGIPISNRASLISDAFTLAQSGQLSQVTAFNLTFYLEAERDYVPWRTVQRVMGYVDLMLSRSPAYGLFSTYMMQQVQPFYDYVGWDDFAGTHLDQLGRVIGISYACNYGNEECVNTAVELYSMWMNDDDPYTYNPVPPNQKYTVYCTAIAEGGQEEWNFAYDQYLTSTVATERSTLLQAMGCSKQPWILSMYLEMSTATNGSIRSQDAVDVVSYVAYNPVGYGLAWDFFQTNWDYFRREYGSSVFQFTDLIESVTAHFNTEFELTELIDFIATHPDQGTGSRALTQAVDQTRANIKWMQDYEEEVMEWLQWAVTA